MADYSLNINTVLYKYRRPVYATEPTGERQTFIPLKLNLGEGNFNFDLARDDGLDFRLAESSNGTGVLQTWVAYWDAAGKRATLYFKLPAIQGGETKVLFAFWGYEYDTGISDLRPLVGESTEEDIVYTDNLALGASTSGSSPGTVDPDYAFDGLTTACDIIQSGWVQCNFNTPLKINKLVATGDGFGWYGRGFELRGSNDAFISEDVLITDITDNISAETKEYYFGNDSEYINYRIVNDKGQAYWRVQEIELMSINVAETYSTPVLLFGDDFEGSELNVNKWPTSNGSWTISNSRINLGVDAWIRSSETLGGGSSNFIVEEGIVGIGNPSSTTVAAHRYRFYGGENVFGINYYWDGSTDRKHDVSVAGTYVTYNGVNRGLEEGSYSQNHIAYYEATDNIYQGMLNRATYADYNDNWERQVHRNTELTDFRIYGEDSGSANGVAVDWVIARSFVPESDPVVDTSELWVDYEYVGHQLLDYTEYTSDVTSVDFYHMSDMGGDPYRMSDDITNSIQNIFISDDSITEGSLIIDFGRGRYTITDNDYIHFNSSNSVEYYNASKLSDLDTDIHGRDYWQTTTTYGWAAIEFPTTEDIACLALKAVPGSTGGMPDNFRFYGSQSNPRFAGWYDKVLIYEGQARAVEEEQTFYFSTGLTFYKYYILEVLDTHGSNVAIQEWKMYERSNISGKKVISQLRLHPVTFIGNEYYFVKEIEFYGSNDGFTWDLLIPNTDTPTPFTDYTYDRWSRYSFENLNAYYLYKLTCYDNWYADNNQIKMAEWEMVENTEEVNNFRILAGSSNNINNIWADPNTTINSGTMYATNEELNTIEYDKLIQYATVSGAVDDFNVKL